MPTPFHDEHLGRLLALETCVVLFYRKNPSLVDFNVDKIYEAIQRSNEKELQGKEAPSFRWTELEEALYNELLPIAIMAASDDEDLDEVAKKLLIDLMKHLRKSIKTWTGKAYGRQGYLNYINNFIP